MQTFQNSHSSSLLFLSLSKQFSQSRHIMQLSGCWAPGIQLSTLGRLTLRLEAAILCFKLPQHNNQCPSILQAVTGMYTSQNVFRPTSIQSFCWPPVWLYIAAWLMSQACWIGLSKLQWVENSAQYQVWVSTIDLLLNWTKSIQIEGEQKRECSSILVVIIVAPLGFIVDCAYCHTVAPGMNFSFTQCTFCCSTVV